MTVFFRDKTAAKDINSVSTLGYWDNTTFSRKMGEGDSVWITPTRSNYETFEDWLMAPAILATSTGAIEKVKEKSGTWPSGKGGYKSRHHLKDIMDVTVGDLASAFPSEFIVLMKFRQGSVGYA